MASRFAKIYFIRNNGGTYEAWQDNEASPDFSGTDLVTDVLNAIVTAETNDFMILFGVGSFSQVTTDTWAPSGVSEMLVAGAGNGQTIISNSSGAAADTPVFDFTNCDGFTIRDLSINAGGAGRSTSAALRFRNCDRGLLERVIVTASRGPGIVFDGSFAGEQAKSNEIRNCRVTGTQTTDGHGIVLLAAELNHISDCEIHDTVGDGVHITKAGTGAGRPNAQSIFNQVVDSRIINCGRDGVRITSSNYNKVTDSTILNSADDTASRDGVLIETANSIFALSNIIRDNTIVDDQGTPTQRYGVNVAPAVASQAPNTRVEGNVFEGNVTANVNDAGLRTRIRGNDGFPDNPVREHTAFYSIPSWDPAAVFQGQTDGGAFNFALPSNADAKGRTLFFRREGANNLTLQRNGADTIDGIAANFVIEEDLSGVGLFSVGDGDWKTIKERITETIRGRIATATTVDLTTTPQTCMTVNINIPSYWNTWDIEVSASFGITDISGGNTGVGNIMTPTITVAGVAIDQTPDSRLLMEATDTNDHDTHPTNHKAFDTGRTDTGSIDVDLDCSIGTSTPQHRFRNGTMFVHAYRVT